MFMDFENFKSSICHSVKNMGDIEFLLEIVKSNKIHNYYENDELLECYYLLGMVDYLCRVNDLPYNNEYNYIRQYKLENPVFPSGIHVLCSVFNSDEPKNEFLKKAIPEFLRYNIVLYIMFIRY